MIDIKAIRAAAEADIECPHEHYEVPMSEVQSSVLIALCDEVERLQHANGNPLAMLGVDQLRDENKELRQEVESLRNGMFNIANQSTEPAIQEFARSYLRYKP